MGATTFTIGGTDFDELDSTDGRKALKCSVAAPRHRVLPYHAPGSDGDLLIFDGRTGQKITFIARYIGTYSTILDDWETDRNSWVGAPIDVTDENGTEYERCVLESAEMVGNKITGISGASGRGFFDVIVVVDWKG